MTEEHDKQCDELVTERMRYFTGRYLTARDLRDEQDYYLTHRYLHNRMMHGWGVVCGLHVYEHPNPACRNDRVKVNSGLAIDCCGREVVVNHTLVPPPIPWKDKPPDEPQATPTAQHGDEEQKDVDNRPYPLLCINYYETEIERVPVLYNESNCDEQRREYSRISEGYKFEWHWVRYAELPDYHWKIPGGKCEEATPHKEEPPRHLGSTYDIQQTPPPPAQQQVWQAEQRGAQVEQRPQPPHEPGDDYVEPTRPCPEDDCDSPTGDHQFISCLEPRCPPSHCVPLAWVRVRPNSPIRSDDIIMLGRPTLRPPTQSLTHICSINWPHGGVMPRSRLERLRRLEIRFDRRLKKTDAEPGMCGPYGINPCTFVVQFGGGYEDLDFVTFTEPPHVEHDCVAVYDLDPRKHEDRKRPFAYLENHIVNVTLKCDFILDCHGVPVDGNHLAGLLPSGDGIRGGTFESWFRVIPDHEWESYRREQPRDEERGL